MFFIYYNCSLHLYLIINKFIKHLFSRMRFKELSFMIVLEFNDNLLYNLRAVV